jgi:ABC-type multidrug transport system fused ATPase/permease subunit
MALGIGGVRLPSSERAHGRRGESVVSGVARTPRHKEGGTSAATPPKKTIDTAEAWKQARELMWARRGRLALGLLLMLVNRLSGLVLPATSKYLIDDVIGRHRAELLMPLALVAGAATLVQAVTSFALSQVLGVAAQRAITEMRRRVEAHVARLPVRYFDSTQSGVLISRIMSDAEGIRNLVGTGLVQLTGSIVTAIAALGYLFYLNWVLTCVTIVALGTFGGGMALAFKRLRPLFRERGKINAEVTGRLNETLGGIRIVKTYTAEKREELVFTRGVHRLFRNVAQSITGVSTITAFSTVVVGVIGVLMIVVGGRSIIAGTMTLGDFMNYILFTGLMAMPVVQIASIGTQISEALAGLDRIRELMRMPTEDEEDSGKATLGTVEGEIVFDDVSFEYNEGVPVLKQVSFRAPAGTTTALVGSSGSGKSTLISLVMAFNRPLSGAIRVDGRDLVTIRLRDYRSQIGVVLQDNFLFDGTVGDNIRYGRPESTLEEIREVSRIAHADEFIEQFEKKYDTVVGERGVKLSGGQRQRVAIARAILANPRILVLDEATSSLDSESEALIQDGLRSLRHGRTTFVIAHRLSTIRSANQILVIEHGEIVERGTHAELLALGGRYRTLYDKQYKLEADRFINPGEDFTPVAAAAAVSVPNRPDSAL